MFPEKESHEATEKVKKHVTFGGTEYQSNEKGEEAIPPKQWMKMVNLHRLMQSIIMKM